MKKILADYFRTWWTIIFRPIYFYTRMKVDDWREESLTFLLITSWILGLAATLIVFVLQYVPIGVTLVEGVAGFKFVLILPVLLALVFVFFVITLLIMGGMFSFAFFIMFYLAGALLHYVYHFLGGKGSMNRMIQSALYSSAGLLVGLVIFLLMLMTKYGGLDFTLFRYGYNFIYFLISLYIYGLLAVAGRKAFGVSKWRAFVGAAVPVIFLLIFGILFDKIALSKLESWIT